METLRSRESQEATLALHQCVQEHLTPGPETDLVREAVWTVDDSDSIIPIESIKFSEIKEDGFHLWSISIKAPSEDFTPMLNQDSGSGDWISILGSADTSEIFMSAEHGAVDGRIVTDLIERISKLEVRGNLTPPTNPTA